MNPQIPPRQTPPESTDVSSGSGPVKEQYSLDEMLKKLRDQEREKESQGEIVTRSDGSVARKVKRRRRRSEQPEKASPEKENKKTIVRIVIGASVCLFLALGFLFVLISFNSKAYREKLEARAGDWIGAKVDLNGVKLLPTSAKMSEASFVWPENSWVRSLTLKRLQGHANLLSFLGARMGGHELGGAVGELALGMPRGDASVGKSYEPNEFPFDFGRYYCDSLSVSFGASKALGFEDASVSLRHIGEKGFRLGIDEGTLNLEGWEPFPIASGFLHFGDEEIELSALSLEKPISDRGQFSSTMKLTGLIPLQADKVARLDIETVSFPASSYFGTQMGQLFDGEIRRAKGGLTYVIGADHFEELTGKFEGVDFELKNFPFLADLAELFPNEGYSSIIFETDIGGLMRARSGGVAIENLKMAHKNIFTLSGNMIVSDSGELAGRLSLLINRGLVKSEPQTENLPGMSRIMNGYSRVDFDLKGTAAKPEDTFRVVVGLQATLPGDETLIPEKVDLWDLLTPQSADEE